MRDVTPQGFGYLIAFLLPGFIILAGVSAVSDTVARWVGASGPEAPTIGGFLYGTLAAVGAGLFASTIRWLIVDTLHHHTGIPAPTWNYRKLQANAAAFEILKQDHYRFFQMYGNSLVALPVPWISLHVRFAAGWMWFDALFLIVGLVCYLGSRDTLRKYYERVRAAFS